MKYMYISPLRKIVVIAALWLTAVRKNTITIRTDFVPQSVRIIQVIEFGKVAFLPYTYTGIIITQLFHVHMYGEMIANMICAPL